MFWLWGLAREVAGEAGTQRWRVQLAESKVLPFYLNAPRGLVQGYESRVSGRGLRLQGVDARDAQRWRMQLAESEARAPPQTLNHKT